MAERQIKKYFSDKLGLFSFQNFMIKAIKSINAENP